mmetsp:Transcript_12230/g.31011  ORF Transcript_12230/g.31011 Transcript_12230/m.31011 type:complete len:347 (+) Transcript_12230:3780-4820(+)
MKPIHPVLRFAPLKRVINFMHSHAAALGEVIVILGARQQPVARPLLARRAVHHLVKDVIIALIQVLVHNTRLLQQEGGDDSAQDVAIAIHHHLHVLAEPRRVVVEHRLGVAKRFHERQRLHQLEPLGFVGLLREGRDVLQNVLGGFRLACARHANHSDRLAQAIQPKRTVRRLCDCIQVRRHIADGLAHITTRNLQRVQRHVFVWVHGNQHISAVRINDVLQRALPQVCQHTLGVAGGQVYQVLHATVIWRVHLAAHLVQHQLVGLRLRLLALRLETPLLLHVALHLALLLGPDGRGDRRDLCREGGVRDFDSLGCPLVVAPNIYFCFQEPPQVELLLLAGARTSF